jgi:hypothetical protein
VTGACFQSHPSPAVDTYVAVVLLLLLLLLLLLSGVCSVAAVVLGQLPGDWGFFTSYLTGAIVLVVLAVGSTAPGLLQVRGQDLHFRL